MNVKFISVIFSSYFIVQFVKSEEVSISPYLNAFRIDTKSSYFEPKTFAYINPSVHNFNVTIKLGDDVKKKEFTRSDLSVTIHTDRQQYYDLEKTDSYTINTICQFNYSPDVIYLYRNICCRITIVDFNFTGNDFYTVKLCKYTLSRDSSACFAELIFLKSFIPKTSRSNHFPFGLRAFAFATNSDDCNLQSDVKEILAVSRLYPISFSNGLSVFWTSVFQSPMNISLELGLPFQSLDPDSLTSLPVKLTSGKKFNYLKIKCFTSENLEVKSVLFDENIFDASYEMSVQEREFVVTIMLNSKGTNYQKSTQWWINGGLLLFVMNGRIVDGPSYSPHRLQPNAWIKCQIISWKTPAESKAIAVPSNGMKKIPIAINAGKFVIIPILKMKSYFSIFNDIDDPIGLEDGFITLYSIHNVRDGSLVDVSNTATCDPIDRTSILCPTSMMKSTNPYFPTKYNQVDSEVMRLIPNKFDLILQMKTWKSVIFSPIDVWIGQDWRLEIADKTLNKVEGWRSPVRSVQTKEIICVKMFQRSHIKVLTRLANRNPISEKEYYGSANYNLSPLLDVTQQIQKESIEFSSTNTGISYDEKSSELSVDPQSKENHLDLRLLTLNSRRLLAIERVKISLDPVKISTIKAFCLSSLDLYQDKNDRLSNYRQLFVRYTLQNDTKKYCYLSIVIVFSDFSEIPLDQIPNDSYRMFITRFDYSNNRYIEIPIESTRYISYSNVLNITIYESDICQYPQIVFSGLVRVNYQKSKEVPKMSTTILHHSTKLSSVVHQTTTNGILVQNKELLMNLSSLYYGLYALIALVSLVALIVLINCLVKFNYRKIYSQSSTTINQSTNNKLLNSAQPPPIVDTSPTFPKHPPLLPPPGPLRNASNSEVELASSTFWSNCSSQDSTSFANRKYSSTILEQTIPLSPLNNFLIRSSPLVSSVYTNTKYRHNPSPSSDQGDGGYLSGENQGQFTQMPLMIKSSDDRDLKSETIEKDKMNLFHYPETYPVPPCPPLKWSIQWATSMVSALPVFSQSYTPNLITDSTCVISRAVPGAGSAISMNQWVTNKTIPSSISVPYTKSIDNLCEKSSGLGSLTSTQQEDYSMLSDDDNYHVSINSDKEHYRKYLKKC